MRIFETEFFLKRTQLNPQSIFTISSETEFNAKALEVFRHQHTHCKVYRKFCDLLKVNVLKITTISQIPFLPIQFFKSETILEKDKEPQAIFTSSGTTGSVTSKHYIADLSLYENSFLKAFNLHYGNVEDYTILALLPSYLERSGSSLVYMADRLIKKSNSRDSGFYLSDYDTLISKIKSLEKLQKKTLLMGVSYALLDVIETEQFNLKHTIIMETGGMKGKRKELLKEELHAILKQGFGVPHIHSEYGMTELLSQAYSKGEGIFTCPPWMKIFTRDTEDALQLITQKTGGINVIDLANIHSCSFIATQDLGRVQTDGSFKIMGRFDESDIRGCNLMVL